MIEIVENDDVMFVCVCGGGVFELRIWWGVV